MEDFNTEERAELFVADVLVILREVYGDNGTIDKIVATKI